MIFSKLSHITVFLIILSLAAAAVFADTSAEKTELRKTILADSNDIEAKIKLGIIIAEDIRTSINMNFAAEAESALRLLNDDNIMMLKDEELKRQAFLAKAEVCTRLLRPEDAEKYRTLAGKPPAESTTSKTQLSFGKDIEMPYYVDIGLMVNNGKSILFPFLGVGLIKSSFSSMIAAEAGIKYFRDNLVLQGAWVQGITPYFALFDYSLTEYYAELSAAFALKGNVLRVEAAGGNMLYTNDAVNFFNLKNLAFTEFGFKEKIELELMLFSNSLNKISADLTAGFKHIPSLGHNSWYAEAAIPFSFDLAWCEFGFIPRGFYAGRITDPASGPINIGRRHYVYENAIMIGKDQSSMNYRKYEASTAVDGVFRFFAFPLPAPFDRLYLALNGSAGLGYDRNTGQGDFLYSYGISAGFDYEDNTPFELRFGMDQDYNIYFYMTVVNRISHPF